MLRIARMADIRNEKYIDADQLAEEFLIVNCQVESSEVRQKRRTSEPVRIGEILPAVMRNPKTQNSNHKIQNYQVLDAGERFWYFAFVLRTEFLKERTL